MPPATQPVDGRSWLTRQRERSWVATAIASWQHLSRTNGSLYAGAITYFSFLALFPLILLAVSVAGFVLQSHPAALQSLFHKIATNVPGQFGSTLQQSITTAIDARTGVGIIGLLGVLSTGLGWIGNLRTALDAIWEQRPPQQNPIKQRVVNLGVLVTLGAALLVSVGLTAVGTALTGTIVRALGLDGITGMGTATRAVGIVIALGADVVLFFVVLVRLPHADVPAHLGWPSAVLAAVGFEILKIVGTYTIAAASGSATAGPFAGVIAVLVWIQLVVRFLLFCAALTAVRAGRERAARQLVDRDRGAVAAAEVVAAGARGASGARGGSPRSLAAVGAGLLGVYALCRRRSWSFPAAGAGEPPRSGEPAG